jgi:uncharacterized protein (DUF1778 family)
MLGSVRKQTRRLSVSLKPAEVSLIERAAMIRGRSETEFIRDAAIRAAEDVVIDQRLIVLSEAGFEDFMKLTSGPPEVVPALVKLMKRPAPWRQRG